jgi:hypothetical protein
MSADVMQIHQACVDNGCNHQQPLRAPFGHLLGTLAVVIHMKHPTCTLPNLCVINHRMNGAENDRFTFFKGRGRILHFSDNPIRTWTTTSIHK